MTVKICRVCFEEGDDLKSLGSGNDSDGHKLASCVPEIDVYVVRDPSICERCLSLVEAAHALRRMCIENEKVFRIKGDKDRVIGVKCEVQMPESDYEEFTSETEGDASKLKDEGDKQIRVSIVFDNCLDERRATFEGKIPPGDDFGVHDAMDCDDIDYRKSDKNGKWNSDEELIDSLNEMCAGLTKLEEKANESQLFSGDDSRQSFELDLDSLNLFNEDSKSSEGIDLDTASKKIKCEVCKESHDRAYINAHMKTHDVLRNTYDCGQCGKTFSDTCELDAHNLTHLKNLCDVCGKVCETKSDLVDHKWTHVATCCGEKFQTGSLLQLHTYKKHGQSCGICKKTWDGFNALFLHLLDHVGEDELRCRKCKKTFTERSIKVSHRCEIAKPKTTLRHQCKHCLVMCRSRKRYLKHLKYHNLKRCFPCDQCDDSFGSNLQLSYHLSDKHIMRRTCQLCPCEFESPSLLTQHLIKCHCTKEARVRLVDCRRDVVLETAANFHCHACQMMYLDYDLYLKHMKISHSKCTVCNVRLNDVRNVIDHVNRHFKDKNADDPPPQGTTQLREDKSFKAQLSVKNVKVYCDLCGKEFVNQIGYDVHMGKVHRKRCMYSTKLYTCRTCWDIFDTKRELRAHKKEHVACDFCGRAFMTSTNLEQHVKFHHNFPPESKMSVQAAPDYSSVSEASIPKEILMTSATSNTSPHKKCNVCGEVFGKTVKHNCAMLGRCTIESDVRTGSEDDNVSLTLLSENHCDMCREHFDTIDKLKSHVSVHI